MGDHNEGQRRANGGESFDEQRQAQEQSVAPDVYFAGVRLTGLPRGITLLSQVTELNLKDVELSPEAWREAFEIIQSMKVPELETLDLSENDIQSEGALGLALALKSGKMPKLTSLNLHNCYLGQEDALVIARALESGNVSRLATLDLSNNNIGIEGGLALSRTLEAGKVPELVALYLNNNDIGDKGGLAIVRALESGKVSRLATLDLSNNNIGYDAGLALAGALESGKVPGLKDLYVWDNKLGSKGFCAILRASGSGRVPALKTLYLGANHPGTDAASALDWVSEVGSFPALKFLEMRYSKCGSEGGHALARLLESGKAPEIEMLGLEGNDIGDSGVIALSRALESGRVSALAMLDLCRNCIGATGCAALSRALESGKIPSLKSLYLEYNSIGPEGAAALGRALESEKAPTLELLRLRNNNLGFDDRLLDGLNPLQIARLLRKAVDGLFDFQIKVAILGEPAAGKSALRRRLCGVLPPTKAMREVEETHSFESAHVWLRGELPMQKWNFVQGEQVKLRKTQFSPFTMLPKGDESTRSAGVCLRVFDFGGQQALQSAHRFFLSHSRTMYCVVIDSTKSLRDSRLKYWLSYIASTHKERIRWMAEDDVRRMDRHTHRPLTTEERRNALEEKVAEYTKMRAAPACLVVMSHCSGIDKSMGEGHAMKLTPRVFRSDVEACIKEVGNGVQVEVVDGFDAYDDVKGERLAAVRSGLGRVAANVREVWEYKLPLTFFKVREWLEQQFGVDATGEWNHEQSRRWLSVSEVEEFLIKDYEGRGRKREEAIEDTGPIYMRVLRDLGVVHWVKDVPASVLPKTDAIREMVFNPRWVRGPVYRVLRMESRAGEQSEEMILRALEGRGERVGPRDEGPVLTRAEAEQVLTLMKASNLVVEIKADDQDGSVRYLIVDQLRTDEAVKFEGSDVEWSIGFIADWFMPSLIARLWDKRQAGADAKRNIFLVTLDSDQGDMVRAQIMADSTTGRIGVEWISGDEDGKQQLQGIIELEIASLCGRRIRGVKRDGVVVQPVVVEPVGKLSGRSVRQVNAVRTWFSALAVEKRAITEADFGDRLTTFERFLANADEKLEPQSLQRAAAAAVEAYRLFSHEKIKEFEAGVKIVQNCVEWLWKQGLELDKRGESAGTGGQKAKVGKELIAAFQGKLVSSDSTAHQKREDALVDQDVIEVWRALFKSEGGSIREDVETDEDDGSTKKAEKQQASRMTAEGARKKMKDALQGAKKKGMW